MKKGFSKTGMILMENVVFIILNVLFLIILVLFLLRQGEGAIVLEQTYAKQIALLIDSAKPGMTMTINLEKGKKIAEKNGIEFKDMVKRSDNLIIVKLSKEGEYIYSFFNDVDVSLYPDTKNPDAVTDYVIKINEYKNND